MRWLEVELSQSKFIPKQSEKITKTQIANQTKQIIKKYISIAKTLPQSFEIYTGLLFFCMKLKLWATKLEASLLKLKSIVK